MDVDGRRRTQPVVGIDRDEARALGAGLTERERNAGLIGAKDVYRLPTDDEWSRAVGLPLERGTKPSERNGRIRGIYAQENHAAVPIFLAAAGYAAGFGWIYHAAVAFVAALLIYEHRLVRRDDLSRINAAFFNVNVGIAFVVLAGVLADLYLIGATS